MCFDTSIASMVFACFCLEDHQSLACTSLRYPSSKDLFRQRANGKPAALDSKLRLQNYCSRVQHCKSKKNCDRRPCVISCGFVQLLYMILYNICIKIINTYIYIIYIVQDSQMRKCISHNVCSCHVGYCRIMRCCAMLCHAWLCFAMLRYATLCMHGFCLCNCLGWFVLFVNWLVRGFVLI